MAAPQALKDELVRLLDEAYDNDSLEISRVELAGDLLYYGTEEERPTELPSSMVYKLQVDATDGKYIYIAIRPRLEPIVWPE